MYSVTAADRDSMERLRDFGAPTQNPDIAAQAVVVAAEVDSSSLDELRSTAGIRVWPNSELTLLGGPLDKMAAVASFPGDTVFDQARSRQGVDCRPFRDGVDVATIRQMLGTDAVWADGFRGQNVAVGILDEGINGGVYPIVDGFSRPGAQAPGTAAIASHGSMCAADVLVAAPMARLYDYPFLGIPTSGGALAMFQAVLEHRRLDGTPHLTSNSYGFVGVPPKSQFPNHEVHDLNHPLHRKVREVVASGAPAFFAAGNCGEDCPSGACHVSGIGPGISIHASNSLEEVITVAAVNSRHERIGYSSQGPGMFVQEKPDIAAYSHFFGNFGPGRPGGTDTPFDNGTSAATPVAAGVAALLLSAYPSLAPHDLRQALIDGAVNVTGEAWSRDYGRGIVNAAASYTLLSRK
jgi:subtilisin family serine protease